MKNAPIFIRKITEQEKQRLEKALRSDDACEMKRGQILLASSRGLTTNDIHKQLGYSAEYARQMIHRFNEQGVECLERKSSARLDQKVTIGAETCEQIKKMMQSSPRQFGKQSSVWTLILMAEVLSEQGETPRRMANETLRVAMKKNGISWKRAKDWIRSPDPNYQLKKSNATD